MKNFILLTICFCLLTGLSAQDEKNLQLGIGYGLYRQNQSMGTNISFSADYKINSRYTAGQFSQFGFMHTDIETHRTNYVNQHVSALIMRNLFENRHFHISAGAGLGYTNYHVVKKVNVGQTFPDDRAPITGIYYSTQAVMQMSFPVVADISFKLSKTVSIGARFGGYIPTHGGFFNYTFLNPQVKLGL